MKNMFENKVVREIAENVPYIDDNGNIAYRKVTSKFSLYLEQNIGKLVLTKKVTKDYYYMSEISDDYFEVVNVNDARGIEDESEFDDSKLSFKFGIIKLQRDSQGSIIPMAEKIVSPALYHDFWQGGLETMGAEVNEHFTYIDINPASENFGKQLVPAVLEYAEPFSKQYEGFAKCTVEGVDGYLYRYCEPRMTLSATDLLTEEQVKNSLAQIGNNTLDGDLTEEKGKVKSIGKKH